ncbi:Homocysteine S-methyltransferase [Penicillium nucicola]|uniref:Homocysteine S-methyltransferase n=1 Tax=Penicillium nucicola TaxID=1850975 RepID=UPI002544FF6F|nr:Homocysteine S-methyltransferase [Penicillium nucicola]KAJ5753698.1 Homocysteine S-methyltransferase [Penicillium nucicola]
MSVHMAGNLAEDMAGQNEAMCEDSENHGAEPQSTTGHGNLEKTTPQTLPHPIILDGGMSRELMRLQAPFRQPEWSALALIETPHLVEQVHSDFAAAGADVLTTNSYALVPFHIGVERFQRDGEELAGLAGRLAKSAANQEQTRSDRKVSVAGSLPPVFGSYRPDLFDAETVDKYLEILVRGLLPHVDIWLGETLSSIAEAKAVEKAVMGTGKPLWIAFTIKDEEVSTNSKGTTPTALLRSGETVEEAARWVCSSSAESLLFNCSRPEFMDLAIRGAKSVISQQDRSISLGVYANTFEPSSNAPAANEKISVTRNDLDVKSYSVLAQKWVASGATIVGGCCGIGYEHIAQLSQDLQG